MTEQSTEDLHPARPSVYLDRWVWLRLTSAAQGQPREPNDVAVYDMVVQANSVGVAFPLVDSTYFEAESTKNPIQRYAFAKTIGELSYYRTLGSRRKLMRHQFLAAMHRHFGRPAFKPSPPEPLGVGLFWAFFGQHVPLKAGPPDGPDLSNDTRVRPLLRQIAQWAEIQFLAGPSDATAELLRDKGYWPERAREAAEQRLAFEKQYIGLMDGDKPSAQEQRVHVQARELANEHFSLFQELMSEYRLNLDQVFGPANQKPGSARKSLGAFIDDIPSMHIAVDLKYHLFRDANVDWRTNHVHDIDALSLATPYCHAVLPDRQIGNLLGRSKVEERNGTRVLRRMTDLLDILPEYMRKAELLGGDRTGWDWMGPGEGFASSLDGMPDANI